MARFVAAETVQQLLKLGRPHLRVLGLSYVFMFVVATATGLYAWLMGPALRFLLSGGTDGLGAVTRYWPEALTLPKEHALLALPMAVVIIGAFKGVGYLGQFYFAGLFGQRVVMALRRRIFEQFLVLSPFSVSRQLKGDLLSRFTTDVTFVEEAATWTIASWLRDSLQVVVLVAVAFALSWKLSLLALIAVPIAIWPASRLTKSLMKRTREGQAALGSLAAQLQEGLGALKTVQAFNAQTLEVQRFETRAGTVSKALTRAGWARAAVPGVMEILAACAIAGTLGWAASSGQVGPEELVSFLGTLVLIYQPAKDLGRVSQFAVQAAAALERIEVVLKQHSSVDGASGTRQLSPLTRSIDIDDLHFAWGDRPALNGVSLSIPFGQMTALVGPSGSGKSTLAALLLRLEAMKSGSIRIDGVEVADATVRSVRAQFALVSQEALLFSATVADNIRAGCADRELTLAEVEAAAKNAHAHDFIQQLPQGYQTQIGERGLTLSGGQRQRLCIARALASGAPVLVFDEATSNLDSASEREVQQSIEQLPAGQTSIVIAHRLSTIRQASKVHVLDQGRVVESGSHEQLLSQAGLYSRLWKAQQVE